MQSRPWRAAWAWAATSLGEMPKAAQRSRSALKSTSFLSSPQERETDSSPPAFSRRCLTSWPISERTFGSGPVTITSTAARMLDMAVAPNSKMSTDFRPAMTVNSLRRLSSICQMDCFRWKRSTRLMVMFPCWGFLPLPKETTAGSEPSTELTATSPSCLLIAASIRARMALDWDNEELASASKLILMMPVSMGGWTLCPTSGLA